METSYCFFEINQCHGAVQSSYIEEVFALPELVPIPNAPLGIVGVIDLRGDTLPIVDLRLNDESQIQHYQLTDSIIILNQADLRIGIIVNSVKGIKNLSVQDLTADLDDRQESSYLNIKRFFSGIVLGEADVFILSAPQDWFKTGEIQQIVSVTRFLVDDFYKSKADQPLSETQLFEEDAVIIFSPTATLEERAAFRQRAENLRQSSDEEQSDGESKALIAISLDDNIFGIDSNLVREFITIDQATPIPCCPKHIIGATNLRGEILTVIDIARPLELSLKSLPRRPKAIVVELEDILTAIIVEDIRDALFSVNPSDIKSVDNSSSMGNTYVQGIVPYGAEPMQILDIPMLLNSNALVVNEIL